MLTIEHPWFCLFCSQVYGDGMVETPAPDHRCPSCGGALQQHSFEDHGQEES